MEKTIKKLFFGVSAAAVTALALAPVSAYLGSEGAYAADPSQDTTTFTVGVTSTISLETVQAPQKIELQAGTKKETGTFSAKVKSNKNYTITLSAGEGSDGGALAGSGDVKILYKTDFSADNTGWAIKLKDASSYTALGSAFFTSTSPASAAEGVTTDFTWGVGVDYGVPDGDYSTKIKVTAATVGN